MHFDSEDDDTADEGDEVGDEQVDIPEENTLNDEGKTADGHHDEAWQGNTVCITCANGLNGLWQVAENEADAGNPTANVN